MTKREQILEVIKTIFEGTRLFKTVKIENFDLIDLQKTALPVAYIYKGKEVRADDSDRGTIGFETWDWTVVIEIWAKDGDLEDFLDTIHTAMFANYRFNGLARYSYRTSAEPFMVETSMMVHGMSITYQVLYEHPQGQMH
jgi:hypothetical protein